MIRLLIIFCIPSLLTGQNLDIKALRLDGVITFVYERDSSSGSYFFVDNLIANENQAYTLMNNYSYASKVLDLCGDINGMLEFAIAQRSESYQLKESTLFAAETSFTSGKHFGGEMYECISNENQLIISFNLSVFGIAISSECPAIYHPLLAVEKHCDFVKENSDVETFLVTNVVGLSRLDDDQIKKMRLRKAHFKSFSVIYCE